MSVVVVVVDNDADDDDDNDESTPGEIQFGNLCAQQILNGGFSARKPNIKRNPSSNNMLGVLGACVCVRVCACVCVCRGFNLRRTIRKIHT